MTDEALMRAVRDGDVSNLGVLFERYHRCLFDFLSRMTGDRTAAEDLVQEVFVRILKYRATYRDEGRFETWVFRIARNARTDYFRSRPRAEIALDEATEHQDTTAGVVENLERDYETARVRRALLMLREDRRELIVLARYRGLKYDTIAEVLGVEVGTVKVRMHRALKELREIFLRLSETPSCTAKMSTHSLPII